MRVAIESGEIHRSCTNEICLSLRITFIAVFPSPYMIDLFDAMEQDPRFHLRVYYMEREALAAPSVNWCERPLAAYASVLPGGSISAFRARVQFNVGFFQALEQDWPDVVVVLGYHSVTCQLAMYGLWLRRVPWIFWGEIPGFERRGFIGMALRWLALRPVACLSSGIAAIGSRALSAYEKLSKRDCPIRSIPYYCRNESLLQIKRESAVSSVIPHFLYCGQLIARKGVDLLLRAFCVVAVDNPDIRLTLVGDGPLREQLANSIPEAIQSQVTMAGFRETEELAPFFANANVFVLPSLHDGWGVVINQAVSAGMGVIASDAVGAAVDLVESGVNGLIVPPDDECALTNALRFLVDNPNEIASFGRSSRERAARLSPKHGVDSWYAFAKQVLRNKRGGRLLCAKSEVHDGA